MLRYITEKDDNTKHSDTVGRETENRKTENDVREKRRGARAETTAIFTFCKLQFCTCNGSATANVQCEDGNKKEQPKMTALGNGSIK